MIIWIKERVEFQKMSFIHFKSGQSFIFTFRQGLSGRLFVLIFQPIISDLNMWTISNNAVLRNIFYVIVTQSNVGEKSRNFRVEINLRHLSLIRNFS